MPVPESQKNLSRDSLQRSQRPTMRRPPSPPPRNPPPSPRQDQGPSKRVILTTGVGPGLIVLLVSALLLILLSRGCSTGEGGGGGRSTGGEGAGSGTGFGDKGGPGAGDGPTDQAGAGADEKRSGGPTADTSPQKKVGTRQSGSSPTPADDPPAPPPLDAVTIRPLVAAPSAAPGDPADELGGGGGGGGSPGTSEFFGVKAKGSRFVYIVDCSGSMSGSPFQKACEELIASIDDLTPRQKFFVMFFDNNTYAQFHPTEENELIAANKANKERLRKWVQSRAPGGGTFPGDALIRGLDLKPSVIFLLTDGAFDRQVVDQVRRHNKSKVTINTIAFMDSSGETLLQQIAKDSNGTYRFVP